MAKSVEDKGPTAVLELPLITNKYQERFLNELLWQHYEYYRSVVRYAQQQLKALRRNREYQRLLKLRRAWNAQGKRGSTPSIKRVKAIKGRLRELRQAYGLDSARGSKAYNSRGLSGRIVESVDPKFDGLMSVAKQAIIDDVFKAIEKVMFEPKATRVHTKQFVDFTMQSKKWKTQFSFDSATRLFSMNRGKHKFRVERYNNYDREVLFERKLKYIRLVQKPGNTGTKYAIQITYGGVPPLKERVTRSSSALTIDIGPSSYAFYHHDKMELGVLNPSASSDTAKITAVQRQMTRSQLTNNPDAFELTENGKLRYIKGHKVRRSNNYRKLQRKLKYLYRLRSVHRKQFFEQLSNELMSLTHDIRMEILSVMGWQRAGYGKSINNQAPSQLMSIIKQKLALHDYQPTLINTTKARLSQYHHDTGEYIKSPCDERAKQIALKDTTYNVQRDVYSAFLGTYLNDDNAIADISDADFEHFLSMQANMVQRIKQTQNIVLDSMGMRYDYTVN